MKRVDYVLAVCAVPLVLASIAGCEQRAMDRTSTRPATSATALDYTMMVGRPAEFAADSEQAPEDLIAHDQFNTEAYDAIVENEFLAASDEPLSTFSIDVDTASYSNVRRLLGNGQIPPPGAVRIEELVNYFQYQYEPPTDGQPFAVHVDVHRCPWQPGHLLARIGLKGRVVEQADRPRLNLVFLIDVSGSMSDANKLPLVKQGMSMLTQQLDERDHVAIVVYAGSSGLVLPPTPGSRRQEILDALARLEAGGSTAGAAGIEQAYAVARENFDREGVNRVILCTDGDFNVGITNRSQLVRLIEQRAKDGIFLTVLGFGMGNYKDSTLEQLADKGNGNYGYIDTLQEARKLLVEQLTGTLVTIAKDVKIQVDFNPAHVQAYRLIGYENRLLAHRDFHDDTKDAGEIGAGHTVTALYELVPPGVPIDLPRVDRSRYQPAPATQAEAPAATSEELFTVKLRYKEPQGETSSLVEYPITAQSIADRPSEDFQFAAAVALFGMLLRESRFSDSADFSAVLELARSGRGEDPNGYRSEFIQLVQLAETLWQGRKPARR